MQEPQMLQKIISYDVLLGFFYICDGSFFLLREFLKKNQEGCIYGYANLLQSI